MNANKVTLFIPCLVDQVYPEMGLAMCRVLRRLGFELSYNPDHTCCGQPAFNSGQRAEARKVAAGFIKAFQGAELIVSVSGSCTAMVRNYYPVLFEGTEQEEEAKQISGKVLEFSQFLVRAGAVERILGKFEGRIGFHNSCHSLRELRILDEPYQILKRIAGCEIVEPHREPVCCGFGGVFCVKLPSISEAMVKARLDYFASVGAQVIVSNDPGCIMQMRQQVKAEGRVVKILHLAEFLDEAMERGGAG